jgi:hypothetical protein
MSRVASSRCQELYGLALAEIDRDKLRGLCFRMRDGFLRIDSFKPLTCRFRIAVDLAGCCLFRAVT